ncbi:Pyridine nucleotide-disulfide oxidoreductase [Rhizoctonia solani]|uniref:Pyridine nucleotide-disulfide oxidoreductase n=1 Tax=Rhizoctonia solani TaxID=456999 RepID=A0A8H7I768_9AGAM|nr:Pyridine nucleotide-disulfide oxidoreductase [Rhizoctonia solani]
MIISNSTPRRDHPGLLSDNKIERSHLFCFLAYKLNSRLPTTSMGTFWLHFFGTLVLVVMSVPFVSALKTILVLGGSYGGQYRCVQVPRERAPGGYRVVLLERNSHANRTFSSFFPDPFVSDTLDSDLYVLPRFSVLPSHETKAFIPYNNLFGPTPGPNRVIHGTAIKLERNKVVYTPAPYSNETSPERTSSLEFDYLIYALGAKLPGPIDFWGAKSVYDGHAYGSKAERTINLDGDKKFETFDGSKSAAVAFLQRAQKRLKLVESVLVVGGGALGILNKTMHALGVNLILGQRLDLKTTLPEHAEYDEQGRRVVKTENGKNICADLVLLCTGQTPNTSLMRSLAPRAIDDQTGMIKVTRTMQVDLPPKSRFIVQDGGTNAPGTELPHVYAIGDAADAFGVIKAGHTAHWQYSLAASHFLRTGPPAIKITLGMRHYAMVMGPEQTLTVGDDGKDDLDAVGMWSYVGAEYERDKEL